MTDNDQAKSVVCSREDYGWAVSRLVEYRLDQRTDEVLFSPSHYQVGAQELVDQVMADNLPVHSQLQLHKTPWNSEPGHWNEGSIANQKKAVILPSDGLDSATVVTTAKADGYVCYTVSLDYGQHHRAELQVAKCMARQLGVIGHKVIGLDLNGMGGSALTDENITVSKSPSEGVPVTYVPTRNTVFPSLAPDRAEALDARDISIGVNAVDYSGYLDCRPEFVEALERMANLTIKTDVEGNGFHIQAPLQYLSRAQITQADVVRGADYGLMIPCYQADEQGRACSRCDSYRLRADDFMTADVSDPTPYL